MSPVGRKHYRSWSIFAYISLSLTTPMEDAMPWIKCARCGRYTQAWHPSKLYCSTRCREAAYLDRGGKRETKNEARRVGGRSRLNPTAAPSTAQVVSWMNWMLLGQAANRRKSTKPSPDAA